MKKLKVIAAVSLMLVLTACSQNGSSPDSITNDAAKEYEELQPIWKIREITAGTDGFYYQIAVRGIGGSLSMTYFFDKATREQYPICSKPECSHNDSSCMASSGPDEYLTGIWYYKDKIYRTKNDKGNAWLCRMDTDGDNREKLFEIGDADLWGENLYYLYFRDDEVYITCVHAGGGKAIFIRKRSLDGTHDEIVYENTDDKYIQDGLQWYSSKLYLKEYLTEEASENGASSTRLAAYDFNTRKTEYIELGNFSGYCFSKDENYCFFYRINDGLYKKNMKTGKENKIYESSDGNNNFNIRCIGEYLLLESMDKGRQPGVYVMDLDGNILNEIPRVSSVDSVIFGNENYIFQRGVVDKEEGRVMTYMYIPMSEIESTKEWIWFDEDMSL